MHNLTECPVLIQLFKKKQTAFVGKLSYSETIKSNIFFPFFEKGQRIVQKILLCILDYISGSDCRIKVAMRKQSLITENVIHLSKN